MRKKPDPEKAREAILDEYERTVRVATEQREQKLKYVDQNWPEVEKLLNELPEKVKVFVSDSSLSYDQAIMLVEEEDLEEIAKVAGSVEEIVGKWAENPEKKIIRVARVGRRMPHVRLVHPHTLGPNDPCRIEKKVDTRVTHEVICEVPKP